MPPLEDGVPALSVVRGRGVVRPPPGRVRVRDGDGSLLRDTDEGRRVASDEGSRRRGEVAPELAQASGQGSEEHAAHEREW